MDESGSPPATKRVQCVAGDERARSILAFGAILFTGLRAHLRNFYDMRSKGLWATEFRYQRI